MWTQRHQTLDADLATLEKNASLAGTAWACDYASASEFETDQVVKWRVARMRAGSRTFIAGLSIGLALLAVFILAL